MGSQWHQKTYNTESKTKPKEEGEGKKNPTHWVQANKVGSPDAVTKEALNMQDSAEDQSFQLQQTIKTEKEERKEKACLGCNLLVQEKESHIKLALLPPPLLPSLFWLHTESLTCLLYGSFHWNLLSLGRSLQATHFLYFPPFILEESWQGFCGLQLHNMLSCF